MKHGFVKVAAAVPAVKVADVQYNVQEIERLIAMADAEHVELILQQMQQLTKQDLQPMLQVVLHLMF